MPAISMAGVFRCRTVAESLQNRISLKEIAAHNILTALH